MQSIGLIMNSRKQIAVIAPEKLVSAFSVLIDSMPHQSLLAAAANLDELLTVLGTNKPDVLLVYLVQESRLEKETFETLARIKKIWPDALCITIVNYASQLDIAKANGADLALVDGVNAERLSAAIEGILT
jgi:DNA-binding NarL/FixJ family response regulator